VIRLVEALKKKKHDAIFGLTANPGTRLEKTAHAAHVLKCGKENAVAATKSVVEQALFYDSLLRNLRGDEDVRTAQGGRADGGGADGED
jgi:glutamine---fructose-6-phosphate transaminase (isomerizing)